MVSLLVYLCTFVITIYKCARPGTHVQSSCSAHACCYFTFCVHAAYAEGAARTAQAGRDGDLLAAERRRPASGAQPVQGGGCDDVRRAAAAAVVLPCLAAVMATRQCPRMHCVRVMQCGGRWHCGVQALPARASAPALRSGRGARCRTASPMAGVLCLLCCPCGAPCLCLAGSLTLGSWVWLKSSFFRHATVRPCTCPVR